MTEILRRQTLRKYEHLHEKTELDFLFQKGNAIFNPPVKLLWALNNNNTSASTDFPYIKVAFSVPKKIFKNAVDRNLLKRRMREAYRRNKIYKTGLIENYSLIFIYIAREINPYKEIESKIVLTLQHFKTAAGVK